MDLRTTIERIMALTFIADNGCWVYTGAHGNGYGYIRDIPSKKQVLVHRAVYEHFHGPIGDNHLDHECHNADPDCLGGPCVHRACCNPEHLVPRTIKENLLRGKTRAAANAVKTECDRGHPYDEENTYIDPIRGHRSCKECRRLHRREHARRSNGYYDRRMAASEGTS